MDSAVRTETAMSLVLLLGFAAASAASPEPVAIEWLGPAAAKPDTTVYAAGANVRIRSSHSTSGDVVHTAFLGQALTIRAGTPAPDTIGQRTSTWLPVRVAGVDGWVWAGAVTTARFEVDLDADGEVEVVTAAYNGAGEIVVRASEPGVAGEAGVTFVTLPAIHDINGLQGSAQVDVLAPQTAGIPLLRVEVLSGEYCGSGSHFRYLSLRSPGPRQPSTLALALSHSGDGGDAPIWWRTKIAFDPTNKTATVEAESGEDDQVHDSNTRRYALKDGVFVDVVKP